MLTLPVRCEFLSNAWLEEAHQFLQRNAAQRKSQLGGRAFAVSERFTNAPPHLQFVDGVAAWSMRYDGDSVAVSRAFDERADLIVEADYQAALTAAQFVGLLAPGAMAAMVREVATMCGKDAIRERVDGAVRWGLAANGRTRPNR